MKTLKLIVAVFIITFFTGSNTFGQVWHVDVVVTFNNFDYSFITPVLGIVSGGYTYSYAIKLSDDGKIESIHWVAKDCNLQNQNGDKIIVVDTGHDNLGYVWDFWNKPDYYNGNDPRIQYDSEDGWLDGYMPASMPIEGAIVNMSFKMMIKGQKFTAFSGMVQLHRNSKDVITAEVLKGTYAGN
jgi:hypothetical protein